MRIVGGGAVDGEAASYGVDVQIDKELVLASASPRRQELLQRVGLTFRIEPAEVDESSIAGEAPIPYVERIAVAKAEAVVERLGAPAHTLVLAADTTVDLDGEILAKPVDDDDARRMLQRLSHRTHQVHTAVVAWTAEELHASTVTTDVTFVHMTPARIDWYLSTGEHRDKAGAYGMQGAAAALVARIDGSPSNVIGLPLAETVAVLHHCGIDLR